MSAVPNPLEYIATRIRIEDRGFSTPCWAWQCCKNEKGYGRTVVPLMGHVRIHRATYQLLRGPIPGGMQIDHLCRVKECCNPDHLEIVTNEENARRAAPHRRTIINGRIHCPHGHEMTEENTKPNGSCRVCHRASVRKSEIKHPERVRATKRIYRERNRDRILAYKKAYRARLKLERE